MVWTKIPWFWRWKCWKPGVNQSTLIWWDERNICEALMMSDTDFHNEFRERFVSRPASRRQAFGSKADQCILQRETETEESENF